MHLTIWLLDFVTLLTLVYTPHALTSGTEEALHAIQIDYPLGTLLLFLLDRLHLAVLLIRLLNTSAVVTKPALLLLLSTRDLHLRFKCIVDALSLRQWMIHTLRAADLVHRHVGTHRHALVDLTMSS